MWLLSFVRFSSFLNNRFSLKRGEVGQNHSLKGFKRETKDARRAINGE